MKAGYASMNFAIAAGPMTTGQRVIWLRLNVSQLYGELIDSAASPRVARGGRRACAAKAISIPCRPAGFGANSAPASATGPFASGTS